jgi:putative hemolysin
MIVRLWHGRVAAAKAQAYREFLGLHSRWPTPGKHAAGLSCSRVMCVSTVCRWRDEAKRRRRMM